VRRYRQFNGNGRNGVDFKAEFANKKATVEGVLLMYIDDTLSYKNL